MTHLDGPSIDDYAAEMLSVGTRRLHVLAWRDLDDHDAGGSEVHADQFMRRAAAAGLEVTQRTSSAAGTSSVGERNGYRVIRRGNRFTVFPRAVASELTRRMGEFDALIEVWNGVPWLSPMWTRKPRLTFLHHVHGPMWDQILPGPLAHLGRTMEAKLAPPLYRRGLTLTPSNATRDELLRLRFRPDRVVAVNNGVDEFFQPGGSRDATPLVVTVGRLAPVKRHDEVIEAAVIARQRVPNLRLVIVGEGPLDTHLRNRIAHHGAQHWITLAGRLERTDLVELYRRAWLITSASLAEGWGLTLTEAAACGTSSVATDISGHRSSVVDAVTGVLVPLSRLGAAIADVLTDDAQRGRLERAALARARTLTWDASARGILAALHGQVFERRAESPTSLASAQTPAAQTPAAQTPAAG